MWRKDTHHGVVLAANSLSIARGAAAHANDADGRAGQADLAGDIPKNDAQEPEKGLAGGGVGL